MYTTLMIRFGELNTKGLYQGQYRKLTKEEVKALYDLAKK